MAQKYTAARKAANKKWDKENIEHISIMVPKGYKDKLKAAAAEQGLTVNRMIRTLLEREYGLNP